MDREEVKGFITDTQSKKVYELDGIALIENHTDNLDTLSYVIYKEGSELVNTIIAIKKMEGTSILFRTHLKKSI